MGTAIGADLISQGCERLKAITLLPWQQTGKGYFGPPSLEKLTNCIMCYKGHIYLG